MTLYLDYYGPSINLYIFNLISENAVKFLIGQGLYFIHGYEQQLANVIFQFHLVYDLIYSVCRFNLYETEVFTKIHYTYVKKINSLLYG